MKPSVPLIAGAVLALAVAACSDSPTAPAAMSHPTSAVTDLGILCTPNVDPGCDPGGVTPVQALVDALTARINALTISPILKAKLIGYVNQIPTQLEGLTPDQRFQAIRSLQALIGFVQLLTPRFIPAPSASEIISLANQLIAALGS